MGKKTLCQNFSGTNPPATMISVKQIFLILSFASLASAKKRTSARKLHYETEGRMLQAKKNNFSGFNGNGTPNNFNTGLRDEGAVLIEPTAKECVAFEDALKQVDTGYEGDQLCRADSTPSNPLMTANSACCRMFEFRDVNGRHLYRYYDLNNSKRDLRCICNENTATPGNQGNGPINVPVDVDPNRDGEEGDNSVVVPIEEGDNSAVVPIEPAIPNEGPTGPNECSAENIGATQLALRDSPYMVPCENQEPCGDGKCCFNNYCVCWPISQLVPGTSECLL